MRLHLKVGDILREVADVVLCSANPSLAMSGGVNGAILAAGGEGIQEELRSHLRALGAAWVPVGTVVLTSSGPLQCRHILHVVGVDSFYGATIDAVAGALRVALRQAVELGAKVVAMPMIATGYGPLTPFEFGKVLSRVCEVDYAIQELRLVVRDQEKLSEVKSAVGGS